LNTRDLKDTVDKLHATNKARHEAEQQLGEAMEREKEMKELLRMKDSMIQGKINDIEDMDKSITEKDQ
jgi:hypothetical protein